MFEPTEAYQTLNGEQHFLDPHTLSTPAEAQALALDFQAFYTSTVLVTEDKPNPAYIYGNETRRVHSLTVVGIGSWNVGALLTEKAKVSGPGAWLPAQRYTPTVHGADLPPIQVDGWVPAPALKNPSHVMWFPNAKPGATPVNAASAALQMPHVTAILADHAARLAKLEGKDN